MARRLKNLGRQYKLLSEADRDLVKGTFISSGLGVGVSAATGDTNNLWKAVVGATGEELIEYGLKKSLGRKLTAVLAKKASADAVKKAGQVVVQKTMMTAIRTGATSAASLAGKAAASVLGGPIGIALFIISLTFTLIDMLANPWKNYFNKDLEGMRVSLEEEFTKELQNVGMAYPVEVKPSLEPVDEEEESEFNKHLQDYFIQNGLVRADDFVLYDQMKRFELQQARLNKLMVDQNLNLLDTQTNLSEDLQAYVFDYESLKNKFEMSNEFINQQMANYIYVAMDSQDVKTERTLLMLYTAFIMKKGLVRLPEERTLWVDLRQYIERYWLRLIVMLISFIISMSVCLINFFFIF